MAEAVRYLNGFIMNWKKALRPGMSTKDIDTLGEEIIRSYGCIPSFLNYNGYPASICVSVNQEVVHGIPDKHRIIQEGDIVSLDAGVIYKAIIQMRQERMRSVKSVRKQKNLIQVTKEKLLRRNKNFAKAGNHLFDISGAIGRYAEERGYGVVRDLCGHGIGTALHEAPEIPNYEVGRKGVRLRPGMTLAIEPMINIGTHEVDWLDDDWTVVTRDGSLSAHYENTILITEGEPRILSLTCENE